ncbi:MAG: AAA family ATPase [Lachnospiraceae bacterium]|nr:AAA family ATPase [Lachnospiraceae bacterium]
MRLISVRIENFGKLSNFDLEFNGGKNVILHDNGYGKTTLADFIKVMFYGFDNDGRKGGVKEREKYKPWQGGVYGGTIRFEVSGKTYILRRTFADKAAGDEFELRDAVTNTISNDYSVNIGEELFLLDAESFKKAMYIGQNAVETSTSDRINSHVTTGAEALEDLGGFEKAINAITDRKNNLNERRKNSEIGKLKEDLEEAKREIMKEGTLNQSYRNLTEKINERRGKLEALKQEEEGLFAKQGELSKKKDLAAKKKEFDLLNNAATEANKKVSGYKAEFKGKIVSEAEVEGMLNKNSDLISAESAANAHKLSDEELRRLDELERMLSDKSDESTVRPAPKYRKPIVEIIGMITAAIAVIAGIAIILMYKNHLEGGLFAGIGFAAIIIFIVLIVSGKNKYRMALSSYEAEIAAEKKRKEEIRELNEAERNRLVDKKKEFDTKSEETLKIRGEITEFLASAGITADANPMPQLLSLQDLIEDYGHALEVYEEADKKLKSFIADTPNIEEVKSCEDSGDNNELTGINDRLTEISHEKESINSDLKVYDGNMDDLNELFEGIEDAKSKRDSLDEEITALRHEATVIEKTEEFLLKAKESFISRYTAPVLDAFKRYYGMLAPDSDKFLLDANINITKEELGAQREIENLSSGNRDLVGLALRMAFVDAMTRNETPFIIMDDPFVNFDTVRVEAAKKFLDEISKEYQVIYLTCYEGRR